jgi:hypothetical protein
VLNTIIAELRKVLSLPSTFVAAGISLVGTCGLAALSANSLRKKLDTGVLVETSTTDAGLAFIPFGVIGAIVLGVVIISSEYTSNNAQIGGGRQILTSLASVPRRGLLLTAKAIVLALVTGILAAVTIPCTIVLSQALLGKHGHSLNEVAEAIGWRIAGAIVFWIFTALIAFAITVVTRSGVVPLIVLIANSALVSVTFLLTKITRLARYLPDVAGAQMFAMDYPAEDMLGPLSGGVVMGAWTVGLLLIAGTMFARRDA